MSEHIIKNKEEIKEETRVNIKNSIKNIFKNLGADVCGVASIELFDQAPKGFHPCDIYTECKSVIVFGKALPKGLAEVSPRFVYQHFNHQGPIEADRIAYQASLEIEKYYHTIAVPLPSDSPYEYWDEGKQEGRGLISMKHAAELAGIGKMGKSKMLLNKQYGSMLSLGAVLTKIELTSDEPAKSICLEKCSLCIDNCPSQAISSEGVEQARCRKYTYDTTARGFSVVNCNRCRTKCPMVFGER